MKYLAIYSLLFTLVACFGNENEFGVLKIDTPEAATFEDKVMENGVHFTPPSGSEKWDIFSIYDFLDYESLHHSPHL